MEKILSTDHFDLIKVEETPGVIKLKCLSDEVADKHVVRIDLLYNGRYKDVDISKYYDCNINYGLKMETTKDKDIKEFIEVLEDALIFTKKTREYIQSINK